MPKQYSIAKARDHFTSLVRIVERGSAVELTRRGKPVAVMLSIQEYKRLSTGQASFWEAYSSFWETYSSFWETYSTFREQVNLEELGIEPDTFAGLRDRSPE